MIDWDKVRSLQEDVGVEDFDEIVEIFLEEVGEVVEKLKSTSDRKTLGEDMHFLKGSASNLGFTVLSDMCHDGEKAAEAGNEQAIDIDAVLNTYEMSKQTFLRDLPALNAA